MNKPRARAVLAAAVALSVAPDGFAIADFAAKVNAMGALAGADYTVRQAAYDIRKLRGKHLVVKPDHTRRYHVPGDAARTMSALGVLRDQVIAPILAGVRSPRPGRRPSAWTPKSTGTTKPCASTCKPSSTTSTSPQPHRQHFCGWRNLKRA